MFLVWISIHFLNLSSLSESANLLRFIILLASIVQRFYPVPLDNRRGLRVLIQGRAGWLSNVAIVWLDGEFTTTSFSHIRMQIVNEDFSDSWVEGEDFYSRDVRHEEVYQFADGFCRNTTRVGHITFWPLGIISCIYKKRRARAIASCWECRPWREHLTMWAGPPCLTRTLHLSWTMKLSFPSSVSISSLYSVN